MKGGQFEFIRGRMTDADRAEIDRMAAASVDPKPYRIARAIKRHQGTVFWYMLNKGYLKRTLRYYLKPYERGGKMVHPYSREHDVRITALRVDGMNPREIAEIITREFGIERSGHSVDVRLKFLAAYEEEPDDVKG